MAADLAEPSEALLRRRRQPAYRVHLLESHGLVKLVHVELGEEREQMEAPERPGRLSKGGSSRS